MADRVLRGTSMMGRLGFTELLTWFLLRRQHLEHNMLDSQGGVIRFPKSVRDRPVVSVVRATYSKASPFVVGVTAQGISIS